MLLRAMPADAPPWDALWWSPRIHLALFVHRVDGVEPGLYLLARDAAALDRLRAACGREFLWDQVHQALPLFLLARGDCRALARRLSCHQDIAADGFFSLGMIAEFDASVEEFGPSFYRHLFWEAGVVGQVLYLEAETAGARATGIGCFFDDPVHEVLGIADHAFQSLYHFTVGIPVEDRAAHDGPRLRMGIALTTRSEETAETAEFLTRCRIGVVGADPRVRPGADTMVGPYGDQFCGALLEENISACSAHSAVFSIVEEPSMSSRLKPSCPVIARASVE